MLETVLHLDLDFEKLSTASTGKASGAYLVHMEYHRKLSFSSRAFTTIPHASRNHRPQFTRGDWSEARLCDVGSPDQHRHLLGDATNNVRSAERHTMDPLHSTWRPGLWWWLAPGPPYPPTQPAEDTWSHHNSYGQQIGLKIREKKTWWQWTPQTPTRAGKRRRSTYNWRVYLLRQHC